MRPGRGRTPQQMAGVRAFVMALVAAVCWWGMAGGSGPVAAAGVPLRQVDWRAVLAGDPAIAIDPSAYQVPGITGPYVRVAGPQFGLHNLEGYALTDDAAYADLDGDGAEEAVIPVASGGTAGLLGLLLYREDTPGPRLVLVETGYKLSFTIEPGQGGSQLVIYQPNFVGFEPNCCPSSMTRTTNTLQGDALVAWATEVEPNDVQEITVAAFYRALADRQYEEAYSFLSPAYQASNPFETWKAGFATTQSVQVETATGTSPSEVLIELTAVDRRPGGGTVTQRFRGAWTLVWSGEQTRWLLDRARIQPA